MTKKRIRECILLMLASGGPMSLDQICREAFKQEIAPRSEVLPLILVAIVDLQSRGLICGHESVASGLEDPLDYLWVCSNEQLSL